MRQTAAGVEPGRSGQRHEHAPGFATAAAATEKPMRTTPLAIGVTLVLVFPISSWSQTPQTLFEPDSLDFWVAHADSQNVAAHTRFTHYNLAELLQSTAHGP